MIAIFIKKKFYIRNSHSQPDLFLYIFIEVLCSGSFFKKIEKGCSSRLQNFNHLFTAKSDFVTHHYTKLLQKTPNLEQIGCFLGQIFQNAPNLANWAHLDLDQKPTLVYKIYFTNLCHIGVFIRVCIFVFAYIICTNYNTAQSACWIVPHQ